MTIVGGGGIVVRCGVCCIEVETGQADIDELVEAHDRSTTMLDIVTPEQAIEYGRVLMKAGQLAMARWNGGRCERVR